MPNAVDLRRALYFHHFIMRLALIPGDDTLRINLAIFPGALRAPECMEYQGFLAFPAKSVRPQAHAGPLLFIIFIIFIIGSACISASARAHTPWTPQIQFIFYYFYYFYYGHCDLLFLLWGKFIFGSKPLRGGGLACCLIRDSFTRVPQCIIIALSEGTSSKPSS